MAAEFESCVAGGLDLSRRIYYGKELPAPVPEPAMSKSNQESYLPTAVMVYAVVYEPEAVDNPDVPSYQPYVHGRCEPPALIPLQMNEVAMEVDCCLDCATVSFSGKWRVHCIKTSRKCDCRIAVPMGDQGSILGLEVDITGKSYHSQLIIPKEEAKNKDNQPKIGDGNDLKGYIYTFKIPQVGGGTTISVKVTWSQKLDYNEGQFCLNVPFNFPAYVNPVSKKISKREKVSINVNSGTGKEIIRKSNSHGLKEIRREIGKLGFLYEAQVPTWSSSDFTFSFSVAFNDIFGGVLLQSPILRDFDDRQMFCFYLFPGTNQSTKAFRKDVIFIIDISGSMKGQPLENAKTATISSLSKLDSEDSFNIIAFNGESFLFSSLMEPATRDSITRATQWLNDNLTPDGRTNILVPLKQAMKLLAETTESIPLILLVTDGAVEDERDICSFVKDSLKSGGPVSPRICTLGIGAYCNHYFLQMLAQIGRGYFDTAYDADSIDSRMQRLFTTASSLVLANITVDSFEQVDSLELLPFNIPDLSSGSPLIVSGKYNGNFPDSLQVNGILADMTSFTIELNTRRAKDVQLDKILARRQIDLLTSKAWLSGSKEIEHQVAKMSIQTGVPSEYTQMVLHLTHNEEKAAETVLVQEVFNKINVLKQVESDSPKKILLGSLGVGFGDMSATSANIPPGTGELKSPEATEMLVKAASNCCSKMTDSVYSMFTRSIFFSFLLLLDVSVSISNGSEEETLAMIKPDGLFGNHTDTIKKVIVESGFSIYKEIITQLDQERASTFYAEHSSRGFFPDLIKYMTSGPVLAMVLKKENAVSDWRTLIGPTDSLKAKTTHPHSIRAMCGLDSEKNCVHGSDSLQSAQREISFFFGDSSAGEAVEMHDEL
ncbi:Nucleoside diphosphate kinase family protein [Euphorbia peplus]|nr:Nucleoside diphosphate kinase family protein [Euphorbia peplus]